MYTQTDLAMDLEKTLTNGFDIFRISKTAFHIYQEHGLELTEPMDHVLLTLMAMAEGPEFELTEPEFVALITEIKAM